MKHTLRFSFLFICLLLLSLSYGFPGHMEKVQASLVGSWKVDDGSNEHILVFADGYITYAGFNSNDKTFLASRGGSYRLINGALQVKWEYDTDKKGSWGQFETFNFTLDETRLVITVDGRDIPFDRIDDGKGLLAGNWRITGRMQDGKVNAMNAGTSRKTIKILSGTRFQWVAINPETKEFFGTGGGSYSFTNGKYTENIQFFSRDSSRVGTSINFDDKIVNDDWHHTGKSSTGEQLYEIWSRVSNNPDEKK